jgi:flagella basal body P-ring formation protein FlgA
MNAMSRYLTTLAATVFVLCAMTALPAFAGTTDASIVDRVISYYALDTSAYTVEVVSSSLTNTELAPSEISFTPLSDKEPIGLFTILVTADRNGAVVDRGQVRLRIRKFADVAVLSKQVKFHQSLDQTVVAVKRMEVTNLREQPLAAGDDPSGYRAKRNLTVGQILTNEAIEPLPVIESGSEIAIVATGGAFSISAEGIALQDGARGEQIRVKNTTSGRILTGRVVDSHRVAVGR